MDELTREFLIESQEGLDRMERCLTDLEERPQDAELIGDIFRSVHTIKGTTGFLGFKRLEKLAHSGENLLGLLREGKLVADRAIITGLLELLDGLRAILKSIEAVESEGEGEDTALITQLEELQVPALAKHPARLRAGVQSAPGASDGPELVLPVAPAPELSAPTESVLVPVVPAPSAAQAVETVEAAPAQVAAPTPKASEETETEAAKPRTRVANTELRRKARCAWTWPC